MKPCIGTGGSSSQLVSSKSSILSACSSSPLVTFLVFLLEGEDAPDRPSPVLAFVLLEGYTGEIKGSMHGCFSLVTFIVFLQASVDASGSIFPPVFTFVLLEANKGEIRGSVCGCSFLAIFLVFLLGGDDGPGSTPPVFTLGLLIL